MEITYTVAGMSCGHCKSAVEGELGRLPGVQWVHADLETKLVVVRGGPSRTGRSAPRSTTPATKRPEAAS